MINWEDCTKTKHKVNKVYFELLVMQSYPNRVQEHSYGAENEHIRSLLRIF